MKLIITSVGLNLHKRPSASAALVDQLSQGDVLEKTDQKGNWYQVRVLKAKEAEGEIGWVDSRFVVPQFEPRPPLDYAPPPPVIKDRSGLIVFGVAAVAILIFAAVAYWLGLHQ